MASLTAMRPTLQRTRFGKPIGLGGRPRPVALVAATKRGSESKPNYVLDAPTRLWEIGSSYWFPFSGYKAPDYLDGTLPGDRGFDPFSLGASWGSPPMPEGVEPTDAQRLNWLLEGELYNGRLAMLAVVGVLAIDLQGDSEWWTAPYRFNWPVPYAAGVIAAHVVFALLEKKRIENYIEKGEAGHFGVAVFDPLGITDDYKRQAEVRNCRLAMLTFLGYSAQAYVTGMGPIESALAHLKDPFGANIFTYGEKGTNVAIGFIAFSVAMHLAEVARSNAEKKALA